MKLIKLKYPETLKECLEITCEDCYLKGIMQKSPINSNSTFCPHKELLFKISI